MSKINKIAIGWCMAIFTVWSVLITPIYLLSEEESKQGNIGFDLHKYKESYVDYLEKSRSFLEEEAEMTKRMNQLQLDLKIETDYNIGDVDYLEYFIDVHIFPTLNYLEEETEVVFRSRRPELTEVNFVLINDTLVIESVTSGSDTLSYTYVPEDWRLQIFLDNPLGIDEEDTVKIDYSGYVTPELSEAFNNSVAIDTPISYSTYAPFAFYPSPYERLYGEKVGDRASGKIKITVPQGYLAVSNGMLIDTTSTDSTKTFLWGTNFGLSTFSFASGTYLMSKRLYSGIELSYYDLDTLNAEEVLSLATDILDFYSQRFSPFSFEKLALTETGQSFGVGAYTIVMMPFPSGLIFYSHEIAHQWWAQSLDLLYWNEVWLNEGFACYSSMMYIEDTLGTSAMINFLKSDANLILEIPPYADEPIVPAPWNSPYYTTIVYRKGNWVLHMLRGIVGDSTFLDMIKTYATTYHGSRVTIKDFLSVVEEITGEDLAWFFDQWLCGTGTPSFKYTIFNDMNSDSFSLATMSESNTETEYKMPCEAFLISGMDTLVDTLLIKPYLTENFYILSGELDNIIFNTDWILTRGFDYIIVELSYAIPDDGIVDLFWQQIFDTTSISYNVYYSEDSTGVWIKDNTIPVDSTHWRVDGLVNGQMYYFKINAINDKNYETDYSAILHAKPTTFPMDRGLLVVDETMDGNGGSPILPTDAQVDSFYEYCLTPISYTEWDCSDNGVPPLDTLAHYKQVLWHDDDLGYSMIDECGDECVAYCYKGGGFILSGWRTLHDFKTSMLEFYGIENQVEIPVPQFGGVYGMSSYPDIAVDSGKMLPSWNGLLNYGWFFDINKGDTIALIDSPDSVYDSLITGMRDISANNKYVILGFPLYYMEIEDARNFLQDALSDIGVSVFEQPQKRTSKIKINIPHPDPFSSMTQFTMSLTHSSPVDINVFDISGRRIKSIHSGKLNRGIHIITWDGTDDIGREVPSSVYFILIETKNIRKTNKVILLR